MLFMSYCASCGRLLQDSLHTCPSCGGTVIPDVPAGQSGDFYPPGTLLGGRFRVQRTLGSGAAGVVYGVTDELLDRKSALKILWQKASRNQPAFERLKREIQAARPIRNDNVVAVYEMLDVDGRPALLMEWVEGRNLRERIRDDGPAVAGEASSIVEQVLSGLSALHARDILHRDVKSGNILLTAGGDVRLGDFGLVKGEDLGATLTADGSAIGTPAYMAPEVIRGEPATVRSDLYAVGVVLFELLTGGLPFEGSSAVEVASRHLAQPPPLAKLKDAGVPHRLRTFVARLLAKDARDRFASADEALAALRRRRPAFWLSRRTRHAAAIATALCAVAVFGGIWFARQQGPLRAVCNGKRLDVLSASGRQLWSRTLPRSLQSACYGDFGPGGTPAVACATTWGKEAEATSDNPSPDAGRIYLFDARGNLLLNWPLTIDPANLMSQHYSVNLMAERVAGNRPEILVAKVEHALWYPAALVFYYTADLDRDRSRLLPDCQIVYNSGHITSWKLMDMDGDGNRELIYAGVNNRLYRAIFAAAVRIQPDLDTQHLAVVSPDVTMTGSASPLFYRLACMNRDYRVELKGTALPLRLVCPGGPDVELLGTGNLRLDGRSVGPDVQKLKGLNRTLGELCRLRDREDFAGLLKTATNFSTRPGTPYDWLRSLFEVQADLALKRYDAVRPLLQEAADRNPGRLPLYYYQFRMDGDFLAGRYARCLERCRDIPTDVWQMKPELADTAALATLYSKDQAAGASFLANLSRNYDGVFARTFYGVQAFVTADYPDAIRRLEILQQKPFFDPTPDEWIVAALLREGKTSEARKRFNAVNARFPSLNLADSEIGVWLRWREGHHAHGLLDRMDTILAQKREKAAYDPTTRAFLPLTLYRDAVMHRDAGDRKEARALLADARRLAPEGWHAILK